jgi:hypothetical protein
MGYGKRSELDVVMLLAFCTFIPCYIIIKNIFFILSPDRLQSVLLKRLDYLVGVIVCFSFWWKFKKLYLPFVLYIKN